MVVIFFSVLAALILLLLATSLKGIAAVVEALCNMTDVWAALLLGGGILLVIELLVGMFTGGFWNILISVVIFGVIIYFFAGFFSIVLAVFYWVANILINILILLYMGIDKLGEFCEKGFMYFLGTINKRISVS